MIITEQGRRNRGGGGQGGHVPPPPPPQKKKISNTLKVPFFLSEKCPFSKLKVPF